MRISKEEAKRNHLIFVKTVSNGIEGFIKHKKNFLKNERLISYECERLEKIRQGLINVVEERGLTIFYDYIKELGEIIYELTDKIKDV